jgi:hypothetical protein
LVGFQDQGSDVFFITLFDTAQRGKSSFARKSLDRVAQDHPDAFKIRSGDAPKPHRPQPATLVDVALPLRKKRQLQIPQMCLQRTTESDGRLRILCRSDAQQNMDTKTAGFKFLTGAQLAHALVKNARKD